ncbi:MAG TPA: helix-turn-helix domain-containing protein [Actinomycetota bacterium]|jgi:AcrR family transcriptional regulator|nr:helix-turn-helix domain-containing protein [Actinomycetota bacterium]
MPDRPPTAGTRERIVATAMRLFAEKGYTETSVSDIQAACGLSGGSGALYKHFRSKEQVLEAGIEREMEHLEAVRMARRFLSEPLDYKAELAILGRFVLIELGSERDLLRIIIKEADRFPAIMRKARMRLIDPAYAEFSEWLRSHVEAGNASCADVDAVATAALSAIFAYRASESVLGFAPAGMDDERFLEGWVELIGGLTS